MAQSSSERKRRNLESARRFAEKHPERVAATKRRYQLRHPDKCAAARRVWQEANPELDVYAKRKNMLAKYGITPEQYDELLTEQGGVCAICKKPETVKDDRCLAVDHDHFTQEVRGLLCRRCNVGISPFEKNPTWLVAATGYLGLCNNTLSS